MFNLLKALVLMTSTKEDRKAFNKFIMQQSLILRLCSSELLAESW